MNWDILKPYFSKTENWGNPDMIKWYHLKLLYDIRHSLELEGFKWPMVIHCSYDTFGHSDGSYHYSGEATDFHFKTPCPLHIQTQILSDTIKKLGYENYTGIGVYPEWNTPGFHIDSRGFQISWIQKAHYGSDGYIYIPINSILKILNA